MANREGGGWGGVSGIAQAAADGSVVPLGSLTLTSRCLALLVVPDGSVTFDVASKNVFSDGLVYFYLSVHRSTAIH